MADLTPELQGRLEKYYDYARDAREDGADVEVPGKDLAELLEGLAGDALCSECGVYDGHNVMCEALPHDGPFHSANREAADRPSVSFMMEIEQEADGRWIGEVASAPGARAYGSSPEEAAAAAVRIVVDQLRGH